MATLGTALTDRHVRKLKGYAKEAIIVFDSDDAGRSAALKSLHVFANEGLSARAVALPAGHDPDSFVNENGLDRFLDLLSRASPMFDFYLDQKMTKEDSDEEKVRALKELLPVLSEIRDFTMRSLYVRRLAERIGVREDVILSELGKHMKDISRGVPGRVIKERSKLQGKTKPSKDDVSLLSLLIQHPNTIPRLMEFDCRVLLSDPDVIRLVEVIFEKYRSEGAFSAEGLLESLGNESGQERLREILHKLIVYSDQDVEQALTEFENRVHQKKVSASFRKANGDLAAQNKLLKMKIQGPLGP